MSKIAPLRSAYTTLSLTILVYLHSFSCCCIRNLRNPEKFSEIQTSRVQGHPRSSILVPIENSMRLCISH